MKLCKASIALLFTISLFISPAFANDCKKAVELYNKGTLSRNLTQKEKLLKGALKVACSDKAILARIQNNLADTYENQGRYEEAIKVYQEAIELDPELLSPYIGMGDVYSKMGKTQSAAEYYNKYWDRVHYKDRKQLYRSLSLRGKLRTIRPVPAEDLYFGFNEAILTQESERQLEELLSALNEEELKTYRFQLRGHTCSIGSDEYNQGLSERRAKAVKDWLVGHGYSETQLQTIGFGEKDPVANNRTEEGRRLNRRVEIRTVGIMVTGTRQPSEELSKGKGWLEEGLRLFSEGKYQGAITAYEKALKVFKQEQSTEGIRAASGNLFLVYQALGNEEKAEGYLKQFQETDSM
jgi:outer membrane protein OmpA-like peptidoglycan-associated protein